MLVMKLKENLMRSNLMRCNNNKNPKFQYLPLEKENKSKNYNLFFIGNNTRSSTNYQKFSPK
ncbi:hypothetical protein AHAS_Ahas18G0115200 [Arachis hypogaea]